MSDPVDIPDAVDYTTMEPHELLSALGDSGARWATALCQFNKELYGIALDEGWIMTWFANAIETATDKRTHDLRGQLQSLMNKCALVERELYAESRGVAALGAEVDRLMTVIARGNR